MPNTIDTQIVEGLADFGRYRVLPFIQATANSTLTLTVASPGYILFNGTVAGQILKLGDATTYQTGHTYIVHNSSTQNITIQNSAATVVLTLLPNARTTIILENNSTAAGVWRYNKTSISGGVTLSQGQIAYGAPDGSVIGSANLYWDETNHRLGIGTNTPESQLHILDDSGANLIFQQANNSLSESAFFECRKARGTSASPIAVIADDKLGGWGGLGWNGSAYLLSTYMNFFAEGPFTGTSAPSYFSVFTTPVDSISPVERMRISSNGNLLIGTTTDNGIDQLQVARGASVNFPMMEMFDDFLWTTLGSGTNPYSVVSAVSGAGASNTVETTATSNDYAGQITASTGTNAAGRATIDFFNSVNKIRVGAKRIMFEGRVEIPTLSATGQVFTVYVGLLDGNASGIPANGIYFTYTHGTNSGAWVGNCTSGSTNSPINSAVTVVANTWYELRAEINAAGTVVEFYIDGVLIGTNNASNIPAATAGMRPAFKIEKSAGGTARTLTADYMYLKMFR